MVVFFFCCYNKDWGRYVVPLDPSLIPADKKYVSKIDDRKDIISIWDMKVTSKSKKGFCLSFIGLAGNFES